MKKKDMTNKLKSYFFVEEQKEKIITRNIYKLALVLSLILVIVIPILLDKPKPNDNEEYNYDYKTTTLTYVVYNASVNSDFEQEPVIINEPNADDLMHYRYIEIYQAHKFNVSLNENEFQFLENEVGSGELEVVVSFFGLSNDNEIWYSFRMIIFKGNNGIIGCLGPGFGLIQDERDKINKGYSDVITFGTYIFLTDDSVVKYYDDDFPLYHFDVNMLDLENIEVKVIDIRNDMSLDVDYTIHVFKSLPDSYQDLNPSVVYDIFDLIYAQKIEFTAVVINVNLEDNKIEVNSDEYPTIKYLSYKPNGKILNANDEIIELSDIKTGDVISTYYYQVYNKQELVDLRILFIKVISSN